MNICIALWFRAPLGGLQENIRETALFLLGQGADVTVVCPPGIFAAQLREAGIFVVETAFDDTDQLLKDLSDRPFDLVHAHPGLSRQFAQALSAQRDIPLFVTYHGAWMDKVGRYWQEANALLGVSPAVMRRILSQAPQATERVHLMPNTTRLPKAEPKTRQGREDWRVLVPSRFDVDKKTLVELLLALWDQHGAQAARPELAQLHWHLAGTGTDLPRLEEAAGKLEQKVGHACVHFHGWLSQNALEALYQSSDFAAAPGRSALNALSFGLPTIVVGSAGCFGLVTPQTYLDAADANFGGAGLEQSQSPTAVFDAIVARITAPETAAEDPAALRRLIATHHDADIWNTRLLAMYQAHIKNGRA